VQGRDYGQDVLAGFGSGPAPAPQVPAEADLVVECASTGFCGAVVAVDKASVTLEDRHGRRRPFALTPAAFLLDGRPVTLVRPAAALSRVARRSASGSVAVTGLRARVARASRLYVEGRHDADLVEKVWGHDLRVEGVVVEQLDGVDLLPDAVTAFRPGPQRRLGVLVDHLVPGSKESALATRVAGPDVLVLGHPFVDVWQAVRPEALGLDRWPSVPPGQSWKHGVCEALGWPCLDQADLAAAWQRILSGVHSFADLEPTLLGRVEELIDFVTTG
jgi:hypothetical protein